jgi:hypothetical protein
MNEVLIVSGQLNFPVSCLFNYWARGWIFVGMHALRVQVNNNEILSSSINF